ncbi:MAG TPA: hypothetical protein VF541_11715, partial [Longimicrobium sp.]
RIREIETDHPAASMPPVLGQPRFLSDTMHRNRQVQTALLEDVSLLNQQLRPHTAPAAPPRTNDTGDNG